MNVLGEIVRRFLWNTWRNQRFLLGMIPLAFLVMGSAAIVAPNLFRVLLLKEGLFEQLTHLFLILAAYFWFRLLFRKSRKRSVLAVLSVTLLFLLEEINWGQLYFDIPTPEWMLSIPGQRTNELNFHNNVFGQPLMQLFFCFILVFSPFLHEWKRYHRERTGDLSKTVHAISPGLPVLFLLVYLCSNLFDLILPALAGFDTVGAMQELMDFMYTILLFQAARVAHLDLNPAKPEEKQEIPYPVRNDG